MNNNKVLPQLGSISDVANIFKYDKGSVVPVDTSEYYPASQKYENITVEDIISKRRKAFLKRAYQLEAFNETGEKYRLTKIEVNGKLQEYTIEAPKSGVSIGELLNPIRLPTECEPDQKSFKVLIPTLKKNSAELFKEIIFPNSNKPAESSPVNLNATTDNTNGNTSTEIKPIKKLLFESNFECGNLAHVDFVTTSLNAIDGEYDIYLRKDPTQIREEFWFFFRVKNMTKNKKYRINFCDYNSRIMRSHTAARPLLISIKNYLVNGKGWERCGTDIELKYQTVNSTNPSTPTNQNISAINDDLDDIDLPKKTKSYIWSMTVTFSNDDDTVYFAYSQPYSYSHHQMTIYTLLHDDYSGNHLKVKELCRTAAGNRVELLTITELGDEQLPRPSHKRSNKSGDVRKKGKGNKNSELPKDVLEPEHTHKIDNRRDKDKDKEADYDPHNIRRPSSSEGVLDTHNIAGGGRHSRQSPCTSTAPQTQCVSPESPGETTPPPSNSPAPAPSFLQKMQNSILKGDDPNERFQKKLSKSILKKVVVILSRAHPGDTNSAWVCDGLIRFLVGTKKQAKALRKRLVFVILPMPSPDGVVSGCSLADPQGGDMASCWGDMKADQHPALFEFRKLVRALGGAGRIEAFLELKGGIFSHAVSFFGCSREGVSNDRPGSSSNGVKPAEAVGSQLPPLAPVEPAAAPPWKSMGKMVSTDGHDSASESITGKSTNIDNHGGTNITKTSAPDFTKIQFSSSKDRNADDRMTTLSRAADRTTTTATPLTGTGTDKEEEGKTLSDKLGENDPNEPCKEPFRLALAAANRTKTVSLHRCRFVDIGATHAGGYHDFNYSEDNKSKKNATEGFAYYAACRFLGARISFCVRIGLLGERGKHIGALLGSDNFIRSPFIQKTFGRTLARSICDILVPEFKIEDAPRKERKRQKMIDRIFTSNALQNKIEEAAAFLAQVNAKQKYEEAKKNTDGNKKEVIGDDTGSATNTNTNTEGLQEDSNSTVVTVAKSAVAVTTKSKVEHLSSEDTSGSDEEDYIVLRTTASNTAITSISHYAEKINLKAMEELWEQPWDGRSSSSESDPDTSSDSSTDSRKNYRKGLSRKASSRRNQSIRRLISFTAGNAHKPSKLKEKTGGERATSKAPPRKRKTSRRAASQTRPQTYNHTLETMTSSITSATSRPNSINLSITATGTGTGPAKSLRNKRNNANMRQNPILENDVNKTSADNSPRDFAGQPGEVMMVAGAVLGNKILHSYPDQPMPVIPILRAPSQGNSRHALKKGKHLTMMQRHVAALGNSHSPGFSIEIVSKNNSAQNSPKTPFVAGSHIHSDMYPPSDSDNSDHFFFNKTVAMPGKSFSKRYNKGLASSGTSVTSSVDKKRGVAGHLPKDVEADLQVISRITHSGGASSGRSSSRPSSGRPTSARPGRFRYRDRDRDRDSEIIKDNDKDNENVEEEEVVMDEEQKVRLFITEMMEQRNTDVINRLRGDPHRKAHHPTITQSSEDLADSRCTSPFDYLCPEGVTREMLLRAQRAAEGEEDDEFDDEGVDWREEIDLKSPIFFVASPVLRSAAGSRASGSPRGERRASYLRKIVNLIPEEMVPHAAQMSTGELPPGSVIIAPVPATIGSPDRELSSPLGILLPLIDKPPSSYVHYAPAVPILPFPSRYSSFDSTIETLPSSARKSIISLNGEPDHLVLDENGEYSKAYEFIGEKAHGEELSSSDSSSDSDDDSTTSDLSNNSSESEALNIFARRRSRKKRSGTSPTPYTMENTMLPLINHKNSQDSGGGGPFLSSSPRANQLFGQKNISSHSSKSTKPYTTRKSMISSLDLSDFNHFVASVDNPIEEGNEDDEEDHDEDNLMNSDAAKWHDKIIHQKHPLRFTVEISDGRSDSSVGKRSPNDKIRLDESSSLRDMSGHRFSESNQLLGGSPRNRVVRFAAATGNTKHYMDEIVHYPPVQKDIPLLSSYSNRVALPVPSTDLRFESPRLTDAEDRRLKSSPQRARTSPPRGRLSPLSTPGRQSPAGVNEVNLPPPSSPDNNPTHTSHEGDEKMLRILNLFRLPEKKSKGGLASSEEKLALETEQTVLRISESCRSIPHTTDTRGSRPVHVKSLLVDMSVNTAAIAPNKTSPPSKTISSASLMGALDIADIVADNAINSEDVVDHNQLVPIEKRESFSFSETNSTSSSYFFKNILANALGMKPTVVLQRELNAFESNTEDNPNTAKLDTPKNCREKSDEKIIDDSNEIRKNQNVVTSSGNKKRVYERRASIQKLRKKLDGELEAAIKRGEDIIKESQNYKERK